MKTAIETAVELTGGNAAKPRACDRRSDDAGEYWSAREEAERTGRSVDEILTERRLTANPSGSLRSALDGKAEAEQKLAQSAAVVQQAKHDQVHLEKLIQNRNRISNTIRRGQEQLKNSRAIIAGIESGFEDWTHLEATAPNGFSAVMGGAAEGMAHQWIVARLPAWIKRREEDLAKAEENIAAFKKHG